MNDRSNKIDRILKGVAIGLVCLFLVLSVFLVVKLSGRNDSMEQPDYNLSANVPPPETVPATESVADAPEATVPATEAPEQTLPATEPVEETEAVEEDEEEEKKPSGGSSSGSKPSGGNSKPEESGVITVTGSVTAENGVVTEDASFSDSGVSAQVAAGTLLEDNTTKLVLTVKEKKSSDSGVKAENGQSLLPLDVHIDGISAQNTAPVTVCLGKILPGGMNIGNVALYHVEGGKANPMTQVMTSGELDTHNEFYYDPATGDVSVAMASFSEIALVSETAKPWNGEFDYTWYDADAEVLEIANADQLAAFGAIVGGMAEGIQQDSFSGKTVKLISDINLGDKESENNPDLIFYPIGYNSDDGKYEKTGVAVSTGFYTFNGTFDGQGHTIANFYHNTWEMKGDNNYYDASLQYYRDGMGLFGRVYGGTVKNLTVKNFSSDGEYTTTGVIAAYADFGAQFENIAIFDCNPRVYNIGNGGIVGCVGWYTKGETTDKVTFKNITVDNSNKISALWGSYDVACGGIVGQYYPTSGQSSYNYPANPGIHFENCHVAAQMDVYNDVCANYQYYAYRYTGMLIGSVRENETIDGHSYPKMDGITATGCTVHFGDWNDYYYCELVANSLASYTHDHQFSRLDQVASVDVENKTVTSLDGKTTAIPESGRVNYVVVNGAHATENATCYHFVDGKVHNHDDYNGDGVDDYETVNGESILVENNHHIYLEFNNLFTGYGWGVTSKGVGDLAGVTILDREEGSSIVKFEGIAADSYTTGTTVTIGDLFAAAAQTEDPIEGANVQVAVSPVGDNSTAGGTYAANTDDWTQGTLTFSGTGAATITITDYNFCTPTTINITIDDKVAVEKFTAHAVEHNAYTQITLGDFLTAKDGVSIGNVTVTITDPDNDVTTVEGSDWATKTIDLTKDGTYAVEIKDDDEYCTPTTTSITVSKVDKFTKLFDKDFLYRVGNLDPVSLGNIFSEVETTVELASVNVTVTNVAGDAAGTFTSSATWTDGTIKFTGTGVVQVTISADGANEVSLYLEVVDATNLTSAKGTTIGGNFVLLCDVNTSDYVYYYNSTLYGNGFTYSLNGAPTTYSSSHGHGVIMTQNATLDNLVIVGDIYDEYGAYTNNNDYNAAIDVMGETVIQNCYISGCSAPISARGDATIIDTTLYGGAVANLIIKGGSVTLENVTTANFNDNRNAPIGMGIVIHSDASETAKLVLNGTLTQYNFINEEDVPTDAYAKNLHSTMFGSSLSDYHFGTSPNRRVNTGIISLTATFNAEDITDNAYTGYEGTSVTLSGVTGYVYTQPNTSGTVNNNYSYETDPHVATTYGAVPPDYTFDYTTKNYVAKVDGSNDYCYEENGVVQISMDAGDTVIWNTAILTVEKAGQALDYTVSMADVDYTGKSITFDAAGNYEVVYAYTDSNNYKLDESGNITTYDKSYTKTVPITVAVIEATTKHAEFTMGSSNAATEKITIDNVSYISATGVTADNSTWTYITIDGQKIYYPIVAAKLTSTSGSSSYAYFPVFENVVTITDYADGGTGDAFTYNSSTTTLPSTLTAVKGIYKAASDVPYWYNLTNSNLTQSGASNIFKWASSSAAPSDPTTYNDVLCYKSPQISADRVAYITLVQYSYTDAANTTYYYYVGYTLEAFTKQSICVTADTLVTLADGTQKEIQHMSVGEEVVAWNFYTGAYEIVPVSLLQKHGTDNLNVLHLYFEDGTELKVLGEHGIFDADLNTFIFIDESDVEEYLGHQFMKQAGDGFETVKLVDYEVVTENTTAYTILSYKDYNVMLENLLTVTPAHVGGNFFNPFEINENMKYDDEKMQADIEQYGLYTYEDFAEYVTYEQFEALNLAHFKVSVGKGLVSYEGLIYLIENFINNDDYNVKF